MWKTSSSEVLDGVTPAALPLQGSLSEGYIMLLFLLLVGLYALCSWMVYTILPENEPKGARVFFGGMGGFVLFLMCVNAVLVVSR